MDGAFFERGRRENRPNEFNDARSGGIVPRKVSCHFSSPGSRDFLKNSAPDEANGAGTPLARHVAAASFPKRTQSMAEATERDLRTGDSVRRTTS